MVSKKKAFFLDLISIVDIYTYAANDDAKNGKLEVSGPKWGLSTFQSLFKVNTWLKNEAGNCFIVLLSFCHTHKIYILNLKKDEAREPKEANKACFRTTFKIMLSN